MKRNFEAMYLQACQKSISIACKLDDATALMQTLTVQADEHMKIIQEHVQSINNIHNALKKLVGKFEDNADALAETHRSISKQWDEHEEDKD